MSVKKRLSATVDADLLAAAHEAVAAGRAENVSAWVNQALHRQVEHEQRLVAMAAFIDEYEAEHGEITQEQMDEAERHLRERAIKVRARNRRASV